MDASAIVAVFPNAYSRRRIPLLARNVRSILRAHSLRFSSVRRDGDVITVEAHDPVFASSAIGLLFGTERVAIARRAGTSRPELVEAISATASSLLLRGERFLVRVGGRTAGYVPRDAEIAATSAIISSSKAGATPGTESSHDRLIHAHVARSSSYVSIFSDEGRGGIPFGSHPGAVACPVYDELSGLAMLETLRQGHDILPVAVYSSDAARMRAAKLVCRIASSIPRAQTPAEFVRVSPSGAHALATAALGAAIAAAGRRRLSRVCVPTSPLVHDEEYSDALAGLVRDASLVPAVPLAGVESRLDSYSSAVGTGAITARLSRVRARPSRGGEAVREKCRTDLSVRTGPNTLHDVLDSIPDGC